MKRSCFARFTAFVCTFTVLTAGALPAQAAAARTQTQRAEAAFQGFERAYSNAGRAYRKHGPEGFMDALGLPMSQLDQVFLTRELGKLPKLPAFTRQGGSLVFEDGTRVNFRISDADSMEYEINGVKLKLDPRHGLERIVERLRQEAFAPQQQSLYDLIVPSAKADINWGKIATIAIATLLIGAAVWWVGSKLMDKAADKANEVTNNAATQANSVIDKASNKIDEKIDSATAKVDTVVNSASAQANGLISTVESKVNEGADKLQSAVDEAKSEAGNLIH
jgi:hypothetical protein